MVARSSMSFVCAGLIGSVALLLAGMPADAQSVGAKFGSRDPRTCATRAGPLSPATARDYFICDQEYTMGPNASGEFIALVSDVTVELGRPRPYNPLTDSFGFAESNAIDPSQPVVPIRGSFNDWGCGKLGQINAPLGKNCNLTPNLHAVGLCFTNSFGDWHCTMTDRAAVREFVPAHAPPTQP